ARAVHLRLARECRHHPALEAAPPQLELAPGLDGDRAALGAAEDAADLRDPRRLGSAALPGGGRCGHAQQQGERGDEHRSSSHIPWKSPNRREGARLRLFRSALTWAERLGTVACLAVLLAL